MPPYVERDESGRITCQYNALAPEFQQARNYLSTNKLQERLHEYPHVHEEAARLGVTFDEAVADICARWPEWVDEAELVDGLHQENSEQPHAGDQQEHVSDGEQDADHAEELPHTDDTSDNISEDARQIDDIREAYEASFDDGAGEVGSDLTTDIDSGGGAGEPAAASEDAGAGDVGADSAGELGTDPQADPVSAYPGMMVTGDPLKAAQMEATWRVGELEAEKVGEYDLPENARRLAELRSLALAAKEGAAPDLTEAQKEELHALETFDGWLSRIRTYADNLRDAIRKVESADALAWINLEQGWPE